MIDSTNMGASRYGRAPCGVDDGARYWSVRMPLGHAIGRQFGLSRRVDGDQLRKPRLIASELVDDRLDARVAVGAALGRCKFGDEIADQRFDAADHSVVVGCSSVVILSSAIFNSVSMRVFCAMMMSALP
jgi:hypothetical protein